MTTDKILDDMQEVERTSRILGKMFEWLDEALHRQVPPEIVGKCPYCGDQHTRQISSSGTRQCRCCMHVFAYPPAGMDNGS